MADLSLKERLKNTDIAGDSYSDLKAKTRSVGLLVVFIALIVFFSIASDYFFTSKNLLNMIRQVSVMGISAVGMTMVLLTGEIDLSVGSLVSLIGVITAIIMVNFQINPFFAVIIGLLLAALVGWGHGLIVTRIGIPALITTLGTMKALRGVSFILTGGLPVYGFPKVFAFLGQGYIWVVPVPVLIMMVAFILGHIFLNKTYLGRHIYGIGGNEEASKLSGVNVDKVKKLVFVICSFMTGLAAIILLSRINSGQPTAGEGFELDVITAVVLGGVSISGGKGKLVNVLIGVLILGTLSNGLILMNVSQYYQWVIKGMVLLIAVGVDRLSN